MARASKKKPRDVSVASHLRSCVDAALKTLEQQRMSDEDVHQARKLLKMARASLRVLRPALKRADFDQQNATLRDAARPLSAARDAKVLLDTLSAVTEHYGEAGRALKVAGLRNVLNKHRAELTRKVMTTKPGALALSRRLLRESRAFIGDLSVEYGNDEATVSAGLERVYARGRRAMAEAKRTSAEAAFHEWRKEVKYLRYALEIFEPLWPGMIGELADQAHKLADYLGEEHDLSVLRETALAHRGAFHDKTSLPALVALIEQRQNELREKALRLGARLYDEKPKAFAQRVNAPIETPAACPPRQ